MERRTGSPSRRPARPASGVRRLVEKYPSSTRTCARGTRPASLVRALAGSPPTKSNAAAALVGRRRIRSSRRASSRARRARRWSKRRLRERAARGRRGSGRGEIAHVAAGESEVSVWVVRARACRLGDASGRSPMNAPPKEIAQFEIVRRLGAGGMAEVFLAKKRGAEGTFKVLVLKRILPTHGGSRRFRSMFIEEAHLATRLNHPNVVQVYEFQDFGDEGLLLAMEYVEGCDLGRLMSAAQVEGHAHPAVGRRVDHRRGGQGPALRAREEGRSGPAARDRPPRRQPAEHPPLVRGRGEDRRLRHRQRAPLRRGARASSRASSATCRPSRRAARRSTAAATSTRSASSSGRSSRGGRIHGGLGGEALLDIVRSGDRRAADAPTRRTSRRSSRRSSCKALAAARERALHRRAASSPRRSGAAIVKQGELIDASALEDDAGAARPTRCASVDERAAAAAVRRRPRADDARTQAAVPLARSLAGVALERAPRQRPLRPSATGGRRSGPCRGARSRPRARARCGTSAVVMLRLHGLAGARAAAAHARSAPRHARRPRLQARHALGVDRTTPRRPRHRRPRARTRRAPRPTRRSSRSTSTRRSPASRTTCRRRSPRRSASCAASPRGTRDAAGPPRALRRSTTRRRTSPTCSSARRRSGRTWVAGGVYRLVRRDFRWGDAPTPRARRPAPDVDVPPTMRVYALERSLSREERLAEAQARRERSRRARRREGRPARRLPRGGERRRWGAGQLVCRAVVGEMGIGKTALVATFLAELPPNARLVHVECTPVTMEVPYAAVAELVRERDRHDGRGAVRRGRRAHRARGRRRGAAATRRARWSRASPSSRPTQLGGGDEDAHARKKNILAGVRNLLAAIALAAAARARRRGHALGRQGEPRRHRRDRARRAIRSRSSCSSSRGPTTACSTCSRASCGSSSAASRPTSRCASSRRGSACATARGRSAPTSCRRSAATRSSCSRWSTRSSSAARSRSARPRPRRRAHRPSLARTDARRRGLRRAAVDARAAPRRPHPRAARRGARGRRLAGHRGRSAARSPTSSSSPAQDDDEAVVRLCARGLCDRKGELVDFRHPLTRDVAYVGARPRRSRADAPARSASTWRRRRSRAASRRRSSRGTSRAARATTAPPTSTSRRRTRRAQQPPDAARDPVLPARARATSAPTTRAASTGTRRSRALYRMLGRRRERVRHLEALRRIVRRVGDAARGVPRAPADARGTTSTRDTSRAASSSRSRRPRSRTAPGSPRSRSRPRRSSATSCASSATCRARSPRATARSRRSGPARAEQRAAAAAGRGAALARHPPPPRRARARGGRRLRRRHRHLQEVRARGGIEARAKNALAYAMFVQGRYEDAIALALESIQIDLSIGGRFQIAKTLTNIGHAYFRLGDVAARARLPEARARGARALRRPGRLGRDAPRQRADRDRAREISTRAEVLVRDAGALTAVTGNAYDRTHESVVRARPRARAAAAAARPSHHALDGAARRGDDGARRASTSTRWRIEAAARVDSGEMHAATLLATTALGRGREPAGLRVRPRDPRALRRRAQARRLAAGAGRAPARRRLRARPHAHDPRPAASQALPPAGRSNAALFETTPVAVAADRRRHRRRPARRSDDAPAPGPCHARSPRSRMTDAPPGPARRRAASR